MQRGHQRYDNEIHGTTTMESNDDKSDEIPLRDDSANKVPCQKAARARR